MAQRPAGSLFTWLAMAALLAACAGTSPPIEPSAPPAPRAPPIATADVSPARPAPPALGPGKPCSKETQQACIGERTGLACIERVWVEMRCRGPAGCTKKKDETGNDDADCDQAIADEGEACALRDDFTCTHDVKGLLHCADHVWKMASTCGGARGCITEAKKVTCDNTFASERDLCREEDDYACSIDQKVALRCTHGRFEVAAPCEGPKACRIAGPIGGQRVECDDSIADVGARCDKEGHYACVRDGSRIIVCRDRHFVADDKCKKKEKCAIHGDQVGCF